MVAYETLIDDVQTHIQDVLVAAIPKTQASIVPGLPFSEIHRKIGFPYIRVPPGTRNEARYTFTRRKVTISTRITVMAKSAESCRQLSDLIIQTLQDAEATSHGVSLDNLGVPSGDPSETILDDKTVAYEYAISATYVWIGEP